MWLLGGFLVGSILGSIIRNTAGLALTGAMIGGAIHVVKWMARAGQSQPVVFEGDRNRSRDETGVAQRLAQLEYQVRELTQRLARLEQSETPAKRAQDQATRVDSPPVVSPMPAEAASASNESEPPAPVPSAASGAQPPSRLPSMPTSKRKQRNRHCRRQ